MVALAHAIQSDIETVWKTVEKAKMPGIHTSIATSDVHASHKLNMSREQVIEAVGLAVANSVAAVKAGARQVECTFNGIGERAGTLFGRRPERWVTS